MNNAETCPAYTINSIDEDPYRREYDLVPCLMIEDWDASWISSKIPLTVEELAKCTVYVVPKPPNNGKMFIHNATTNTFFPCQWV